MSDQTDSNKDTPTAHLTSASSLEQALPLWRYFLDDQGVSPHTVKAFLSDLNLLLAYKPEATLGEMSTTEINAFLEWLQKGRGVACSPKTLARRITSVKAFFRWLHQYGVILADPAEKVPQRTVISPLPQILTSDEAEAVLDVAERQRHGERPDARAYTLLRLLLHTGIKKGETLAIHPDHIVLEGEDAPYLFVHYASPANRFKERKISLPPDWIEAYHEYIGQYTLDDKLFPWSQRRLEYLLEDLGLEAGLDKHLSFDMCRWTCALTDLQAGIDRDAIRQKLGISKVQWREVGNKLDQLK